MKEETSICRICVNEIESTDSCSYLFQKKEDSSDPESKDDDLLISDKVMAIAKVHIKENDGLPNSICSSCLLELEDAYNFKQKCEKSDDILRIASNRYTHCSQAQEVTCKNENDGEFEDGCSYDATSHLSELQQYEDVYSDCDDTVKEDIKPKNLNIQEEEVDPESGEEQTYYNTAAKASRAIDLKLQCHDCGNIFKSKCKLRVHWKKEHNTYMCPHCKRIFKTCKSFLNHKKMPPSTCLSVSSSKIYIDGDGKSKVFNCKECAFSTKSAHTIISHLVVHSKELPYACDLCTRAYARPSTLRSHKERAHKTYFGQKSCTVCGLVVYGNSKYWEHMKKHKNKVPCKICSKMMKPGSVLNHMKRHSGVKAYTCENCTKTFYTLSELIAHRRMHGQKKTYICNICGYKLHDPYSMAKHEAKHKNNSVGCNICGKFLENSKQLALHKERHFERNHKCDHCEKSYYSRKNLLTHLRSAHKIYLSTVSSEIEKVVKTRAKKGKK